MSVIKGGNIKKMNTFSIMLISGLFTTIIGVIFMVVYYLGEQFGFAPVITLGTISWLTYGESVIIFVIIFLACTFLGSFIVLYIIKKKG